MKKNITVLIISIFQMQLVAQSNSQRIRISDDIELIKLTEKAYAHVSVSEMTGFGKVSSNGLVLVDKGEAFLFDTPVTNEQTKTLVTWIADSLHAIVTTFIPNHWHADCMGGLKYLHRQGVKSYANQMTIEIAKEKRLPVPKRSFSDSLLLKLHEMYVSCFYLGGAHSVDNIVVWIPSEEVLFAGCMVKDAQSKELGNLSDAILEEWIPTVKKVTVKFPEAKIVIPGHGQIGGKEILTHTIELLQKKEENLQ
jgi:metallo-beta-lactamase class B